MVNQHAKWLKVTRELPWRGPIPSLNYLLTSHVWRQDHNGFSHQDPGFIDHVVNKKAEVVRVYLPPDANTLLSVADHCLRSRDYVNVIVAGKQPAPTWLDMDAAALHCARGLGIWDWAGHRRRRPRRGAGLRRRRAHPGDARRRRPAAPAPARPAGPGRQRRRPDAAAARQRAPARAARRRVRRHLHHRPAGHLRLPRLPVADPPAHLPPHRPRQPARARLQGGGHHDHARSTWSSCNDMDRYHLVMDVIDRVPGLARTGRRPCASRWSTSAPSTTTTSARTARTCPRSATGPGPAPTDAPPSRRLGAMHPHDLTASPWSASNRRSPPPSRPDSWPTSARASSKSSGPAG